MNKYEPTDEDREHEAGCLEALRPDDGGAREREPATEKGIAWGVYDGEWIVGVSPNRLVAEEKLENFTSTYRSAKLVRMVIAPTNSPSEVSGERERGETAVNDILAIIERTHPIQAMPYNEAQGLIFDVRAVVAALAPKADSPEPVAWISRHGAPTQRLTFYKPNDEREEKEMTPLYTHPPVEPGAVREGTIEFDDGSRWELGDVMAGGAHVDSRTIDGEMVPGFITLRIVSADGGEHEYRYTLTSQPAATGGELTFPLRLTEYQAVNLRWALSEIASGSPLNTGDWVCEIMLALEGMDLQSEPNGYSFAPASPEGGKE